MASLVKNTFKIPLIRFSNRYSQLTAPQSSQDDTLIKRLALEIKGHDVPVLNSYQKLICQTAAELDITVDKVWTPPRVFERLSLLKSVFIYKKHMVQYEMRTNYRTIELKHLTGSTADVFLEYVQRNIPEGVAMKTTKTQVMEMPEHIKPPSS